MHTEIVSHSSFVCTFVAVLFWTHLQGLQLNNHALLDQCAIHNDGIYGGGELPHVCHYLLVVFSRTTVD